MLLNCCKVAIITFLCVFSLSAFSPKNINIVFIGDSITHGSGLTDPVNEAPPVFATAYLQKQKGIGHVEFSNQGYGGRTTVDFLPATNKEFVKVEEAAKAFADKQALLIFSVKLGTNDSAISGPNGAPVSKEDYRANLKTITDQLLHDFPDAIIIYNKPLWYSPTTNNHSVYLQEGLTRLQTYFPEIESLVAEYAKTNPHHVFEGDKKAFDYFQANYLTDYQIETGPKGTFYLHPNKKGAEALGELWGEAIYDTIKKILKIDRIQSFESYQSLNHVIYLNRSLKPASLIAMSVSTGSTFLTGFGGKGC